MSALDDLMVTATAMLEADWTGTVDDLAEAYAQAEDLARAARTIKDDLAAALVAAMGDQRQAETPAGVVQVRGGKKRNRWDSEELARHIMTCALVDRDTGEMSVDTPAEAAGLALGELLACAPITPSTAWRVGALRDRDIDPDEWCESTPAPATVQLTRAAS